MYSDETSKYGRCFELFAATDENQNSYLLGLREMSSKSAETVLDTLKTILQDITDLCQEKENNDKERNVGYRLLSNIRNTMSDRAATEKKFHTLLESFRIDILPDFVKNWDELSADERDVWSKMNNFFCSLHLLVNFADVCSVALGKFEKLFNKSLGAETLEADSDDSEVKNAECGTIRLIRTCSKSFAKGVDERNGVHGGFKTYMKSIGDKVSFIRYKHNRFNVFFQLGHTTYHHRNNIKTFLESIYGCTNRLLSSVLADIKEPLYIAGSRALGLISKLVCGPLWRKIEYSSHVFNLNELLSVLLDFLEIGKEDSSIILSGNLKPFPDQINDNDEILNELLKPDDSDELTVQILQSLFGVMIILLKRQAGDHLPGGKFSTPTQLTREQTSSCLKHNKLPEFFFGQLDFLMKYRPNATTLCNEAYLLFSHNKTDEWLNNLPVSERNQLIEDSRKEGRKIRHQFKQRLQQIESERLIKLRKKEEEIRLKKIKQLQKKQNMTNDIMYFGLWQSHEQVSQHLMEISKNTEKITAVKAQLNFRKNVLKQVPSDKCLFAFSADKKKFTVAQLEANLNTLISESKTSTCTNERMTVNKPLLVGKWIEHKFANNIWYKGKVLSVVPGFVEWYNVKYEGDSAVYVFKLHEDYAAGDLQMLAMSPSQGLISLMLALFKC